MSAMLSVSASAADRVATCIVDARLALAPGGLVLALQLARAGPVWLTRRFWALVDGAYFYRRYPEELVPRSAPGMPTPAAATPWSRRSCSGTRPGSTACSMALLLDR